MKACQENLIRFRMATVQDIATIQTLRLDMLRELTGPLPADLSRTVSSYLHRHLPDGTCLCALLEREGAVIAKAMLCICEVMPDEVNITGKCATLFSVYTLPAHRGHGYMEHLLQYLLNEAKKQGVKVVLASAEPKAIPLYKKVGFSLDENEMSIRL